MFFNNYVDQCNKKGISPSAAAEAMGFGRSVVTRWGNGSTPRQSALQRMADYFGCTVSDLVDGEKEKTPTEIDERDMRLIEWFRSLPVEKQQAILYSQGAPEGLA